MSEKEFTIYDIEKAAAEKRLLECFTSGTAAVCGSINGILFNGKMIDIRWIRRILPSRRVP